MFVCVCNHSIYYRLKLISSVPSLRSLNFTCSICGFSIILIELQVEEAPGATTITAANGRAERIEVEAADGDAEGAQERQSTSTIGSARELFRRLSLKPEDVESAHKLTRNLDLYEPAHDDARALVQLKKRRFWLYLLEKVDFCL